MAKKQNAPNEKELRKEIQENLKRKFKQKNDKSAESAENNIQIPFASSVSDQNLEERALQALVENEVYSKFPEFIKCENHLNEIKWLTPSELDSDFEFYPVEEGRWQKFKDKHFSPKITDKKLLEKRDKLRSEIEADAKVRLEKYQEQRTRRKKDNSNEIEKMIYEEELDKFYSKKKGYRKYINHLGETKWLSHEEFVNQDEFIDEVIDPRKLLFRRILLGTAFLFILAAIIFLINRKDPAAENRAYLLIENTAGRGLLYIDKALAVGFKPGVPYPIDAGEHEISVISSGFAAAPKSQIIKAAKGDTVSASFTFTAQQISESGVVRISAPYPGAEIILDGEFQGTLENRNELIIPEGDHTIGLQKSGFVCRPRQRVFKLSAGDTLEFEFAMLPLKNRKSGSDKISKTGLVEVRSNVKNADIYLDGQKTGFQTDYILQQIPFGQHILRVQKKNYKVYPEERVVRLDKKNKRVSVDFTLTSTVRPISIQTVPVKGTIYIDGKNMGDGMVKAPVPLGEHKIDFGPVIHYAKPQERSFIVTEDSPAALLFQYTVDYSVVFTPEGVLPGTEAGSVNSGYFLADNTFRTSSQAGPEIKSAGNRKYWNLGYAFQYRNPPGRDALDFNFLLPNNIDLSQPIMLKIWAYQTKDNYPLVISGTSSYSIEINRTKFRNEVKAKYALDKIGSGNFESFQINPYLRPGYNKILIASSKNNSAHTALWKVEIK